MASNKRKGSSAKTARTARKPEGNVNDQRCNEHPKRLARVSLKQQLLEDYAQAKPQEFRRYEGFIDIEPGDCFIVADSDNDCILGGTSHELWVGDVMVRVHVRDGSRRNDVIRLLEKILEHIKKEDCPYLECSMKALRRSFREA